MAVLAGKIGSPRAGIYALRQASGSQALADLGVTGAADTAIGSKGLVIFGEDTEISSNELEFLMVQDTHLTETAKKADIVFPLAAYPETDGTYVSADRRLQRCNKAIESPIEYRTSEIAQKIAEILEATIPAGSARDLYPNINYGDCAPAPVLYADGFGLTDKKARLQVTADTDMFAKQTPTCYLINAADADLQ